MSSGITLSSATRQNLLSLQNTADLLATTQNRLSTGKKVNSALDNPVNFFTASSLTSRVGDLTSILDSIGNGVQTIQAASTGITNIQKLVDSAKSTANQALSATVSTSGTASAQFGQARAATTASAGTPAVTAAPGSYQGTTVGTGAGIAATTALNTADGGNFAAGDTIKLNGQTVTIITAGNTPANANEVAADGKIQDLLDAVNQGGNQTLSFAGGKFTLTGKTNADNANTAADSGTAIAKLGLAASHSAPATAASAGTAATTAAPATRESSGASTVTFKVDGATKTYNITAQQSIDDVVSGLNAAAGSNIFSKDSATGSKLVIDSSSDVEITDAASQTALGFAGSAGNQSTDLSVSGVSTRANLAVQYNSLLDQIDQLAGDASFNGVNLLNSADPSNKLRISFNEKNTSNLDISGVSAKAAGIGLSKIDVTVGGTGNFSSATDIKSTLTSLNSATEKLRSYSSTFGSNLTVVQNRQDFTKNLNNVLTTGAANLVNADLNEEAANSQALATRNSIGTSALSLANQAQQGILQLLR